MIPNWEISSHPMTCVMTTVNSGWSRRVQALLEAVDSNSPESDHAIYRN
jgi:hypothetical protein